MTQPVSEETRAAPPDPGRPHGYIGEDSCQGAPTSRSVGRSTAPPAAKAAARPAITPSPSSPHIDEARPCAPTSRPFALAMPIPNETRPPRRGAKALAGQRPVVTGACAPTRPGADKGDGRGRNGHGSNLVAQVTPQRVESGGARAPPHNFTGGRSRPIRTPPLEGLTTCPRGAYLPAGLAGVSPCSQHGGHLIWRWGSRLDAVSASPARTWLPSVCPGRGNWYTSGPSIPVLSY